MGKKCRSEASDAEHSKDDVVARPPRRKRRRVSATALTTGGTASQQQTRPYRGDSTSGEAAGLSRHPKRRQKRSIPNRVSFSQGSTLERESRTDITSTANFEE